MKTTLDLPDSLLKEVKLRALHEGRKLKDEFAELLRAGLKLADSPAPASALVVSSRLSTDAQTGLPIILCKTNAPASRMSAEDLIALQQQAQTGEDLERLGLSR